MVDSEPAAKIQTRGLIRKYGKRQVVNGVDLQISGGEIVGLLGPNGAGKTTTFYMIVGLIAPTSGEVLLDGEDLSGFPMYRRARRGIGYLPQEPSVFRKMTVEQNIRAVAETLPMSKVERNDCVEEHLVELGLTPLAKQKAYTLSGGERRRLEISRALVTTPKFLLMDEPFSGIDPISVSEVQKIVVSLKERGIGVLITDHNVRETLQIVDRAYLMHQGDVLAEGSSDYLVNDPKSREFYLGENFNL
ncbi:MAG: LPS export ABC transporter ATP-binding protein [Puniceicoccaceae bacterium MED-G30]|nr:MAG: LPS export ABC transporter ATP-binding protein [Puniceicoccaceae bacterium MED-G30]